LSGKERTRDGGNLDNSADKVVDVGVASQLTSTQRESIVYQYYYHPTKRVKNNKSSAVAEMSDRLATTDMGRKVERG